MIDTTASARYDSPSPEWYEPADEEEDEEPMMDDRTVADALGIEGSEAFVIMPFGNRGAR